MAVWEKSHRFDKPALEIAERHYSRKKRGKPGTPQFVAPSRNLVFLTPCRKALWVSIFQRYVRHAWPGSFNCSMFRNEGAGLASSLIVQAVALTVAKWGTPPSGLFITMIDEDSVKPKGHPGYCFRMAGFEPVGRTKVFNRLVLGLTVEHVQLG